MDRTAERADNRRVSRRRAVGAAQTVPVAGDVEANTAEHVKLAALAANSGARALVFPELSLTGYEMHRAGELAFTLDDARLEVLVEAARSHEIGLIVGAPLRLDQRLHIAALIIGANGEVRAYAKQHLGAFPASASVDGAVPPAETMVFHAGTLNPLLEFDGHTAAVAVCADANRASHAMKAAERGARTYLASSFVIPSEFEEATANLQARAKQHGMAVVFSNYGGSSGGLATAGRSAVWSDDGELLGSLDRQGSGVIVAVEHEGGWRVETKVA